MTRILHIALVTVGDPSQLTGGYLYHRRLADAAPRFDARITFVSFPERPFPLAIADGARVLGDVRRAGADIIVLDSIASAFLGPWLWMPSVRPPVVAMLHQPPGGIDYGPVRTFAQAGLDRSAYARIPRLLLASDLLADQMHAMGFQRSRLQVVPPGRDVATPGPETENLRRGRRCAFLCVGNWVPRKGIDALLSALATLPDDTGTLHLAGSTSIDPGYTSRINSHLNQRALRDRVVVHGPLSKEGVAALYAASDVFVLPSLKEPYGTVYGEAMAFGLPVVGWTIGNLPYLARNGEEGILLQPGDTAGLARALRQLALDELLRRRLGDAGRLRAVSRPTWDETARLFFEGVRAGTTLD